QVAGHSAVLSRTASAEELPGFRAGVEGRRQGRQLDTQEAIFAGFHLQTLQQGLPEGRSEDGARPRSVDLARRAHAGGAAACRLSS
ncbi:MAG: hypothetical protein VCC20_07990, partial [Myxococcota bacterium]